MLNFPVFSIIVFITFLSSCASPSGFDREIGEPELNVLMSAKNCNNDDVCLLLSIENRSEVELCVFKDDLPESSEKPPRPASLFLTNITTQKIPKYREFEAFYSNVEQRLKAKRSGGWLALKAGEAILHTYNLDSWYELKNKAQYQVDLTLLVYDCQKISRSKEALTILRSRKVFNVNEGEVSN